MNNMLLGLNKLTLVRYLFIVGVVVANFTAYKLISIFGLIGPAGVIVSSLTFLCTDIISELEGKEEARKLVKYGFISALVASFFITLADILPYPAFAASRAEYFSTVVSSSFRIMVSGLAAYLVSQNLDLFLFHWFKERFPTKKWIRNNASTGISQLFDTVVFCVLSFVGTVSLTQLCSIIVGQYIMKLAIALLDTPVFYFLTKNKS